MMENELWAVKYQQSVPTGLEKIEDHLNNGKTENEGEASECLIKVDDEEYGKLLKEEIEQEPGPVDISVSEKAKETIQVILEQIKSLTQVEKFLLFLKLPTEVTNAADPFRQHPNPLGSRSEIYRTISWIKTHLEEDLDISLPKQEVYNAYHNYCLTNGIKPLSQADFGKVMKQVYPRVRARRLGTRGNSRYCYSGLRRCIDLKPPLLPDLADKPMSTEAPFTQSSLTSAAWLIVKDWSEQQLGQQFPSIQSLAYFLILNHSIGTGSEAASKISSAAETTIKEEDTNSKCGKHREMQLQLQRKIQQKNEGKERKRKMQSPKSEQKPCGKKSRSQSVPAPSAIATISPTAHLTSANGGGNSMASGECSTASSSNSTSPTQGKTICDKSLDFTQLPVLPDFKSFQKPTDGSSSSGGQEANATAMTNKVQIPRLQPPPVQLTGTPAAKQAKYKTLRTRLQHCDIASYNPQPSALSRPAEENRSQDLHDIDSRIKERNSDEDECDVPDFPLTRERLNSVSNVEKDAMDEYLGTNNSQHEEELSKYFSNNNNVSKPTDNENTSKLSTLRQLLEQNGIAENKSTLSSNLDHHRTIQNRSRYNAISNSAAASVHKETIRIAPLMHRDVLPSTAKRRVSFETPVSDDGVPPSPNTRRKNFSFTPISPGPQSPNGIHSSKCSSTTASPFVSPRNTPVLRTKAVNQNAGILKTDSKKSVKVKREIDLTVEIPKDVGQFAGIAYVPMSAPVSPMTSNANPSMLHKLLNSSSKVPYNPSYVNVQNVAPPQEVGQFFGPNMEAYRSQSVPLHDMAAIKPATNYPANGVFMSEQGTIVSTDDFTEIDTIPDSESDKVKRILHSLDEQNCDNNNIDIFNLDITSNNSCLPEFGLQLINNNFDVNNMIQATRMVRSQSIDVATAYETNKYNLSKSVPSTPLPFTTQNNSKPSVKMCFGSSRSYPSTPLNTEETFSYNINADCLLNGQPIRMDGMAEDMEFIENFQQLPHDKAFNIESDFAIVENDPTLIDGVLMGQNYTGNIN